MHESRAKISVKEMSARQAKIKAEKSRKENEVEGEEKEKNCTARNGINTCATRISFLSSSHSSAPAKLPFFPSLSLSLRPRSRAAPVFLGARGAPVKGAAHELASPAIFMARVRLLKT
jgi:hypothetical protein